MKQIVSLMAIVLISACATTKEAPSTMQQINESFESSANQANVPEVSVEVVAPDITDALLEPVANSWADVTDSMNVVSDRFDVNVQGLAIQPFLMALVEDSQYNVVVHPDIKASISLNLQSVTVPEVIEILRNVYGIEYQRVGNAFHMMPAQLQTRVFSINYLNLKRVGRSDTRVSGGQQSVDSGDSDSGSDSSSNSSQTIGSQITTESSSDFWAELERTVKMLIGDAEGRTVVVSPQSGVLVVRAMPSEIRLIDDYLKQTHDVLHRQVVLETKILEVELNDGYQTGVNWAAIATNNGNTNLKLGQVGGGSLIASGTSEIGGNAGNLDPLAASAIDALSTSAFGGMFSVALGFENFTGFIEALESQGNVQVLSSPRVVTLNNQKAVIKVGTDEFFVTSVSSTTVTGASTTQSPEIELTPFFSGIALDVIPQIDADGYVTLHIHPSVSEVVDQQKVITVGGQAQNLPLAFNSVREADSIVRARSGEVVVIGGLMKDMTRESTSSVPFLGKVPLLGSLFRHTQQVSKKSELVILLRPVVVDEEERAQRLDKLQKRYKSLDRGFNFGSKTDVFPMSHGNHE